ncbi:Hypothetical protein SRAE_1000215900 [Strongyloides ratti]|uniref:Uncharacterized protein n=1 Tax=Strongyloides ratti TaxID=34506 RepID=A0A090L703_STRRB|nr:Hypothetical protein SRAE_1000215900 [Strongyloides ratti]CEF63903.1 Hypothetical protein SRAE_1000215900 [Strongyloides ratti]
MKVLLVATFIIIVILFIQANGAVYDRRHEYRRKSIPDWKYNRLVEEDYFNKKKYYDLYPREDFEPTDDSYERIKVEKVRRYPGYYDSINHVRGRFYNNNYWNENRHIGRRRNYDEYDFRKNSDQQNPNQFWENGKKYEVINGKTYEVFDAGTH